MAKILEVGALALLVVLIVVNGQPLAGTLASVSGAGQTAAVVYNYDEYGNLEYVDVTPTPDEPGYLPYADAYYGGPYYDGSYYYNQLYDYGYSDYAYYDYPPTPRPWYVQTYGPIGTVAQTLVQGLAPQLAAAQPSCSIAAIPQSVAYGGSTVLQWNSVGATWAELTDLGTVDPSSSWQFDYLTHSRVYTLAVSGPGGTASCAVTVTVGPHP